MSTVTSAVSTHRLLLRTSARCLLSFFSNDPATTEIYTLSLHDALPISSQEAVQNQNEPQLRDENAAHSDSRSEERFSRNAETDLVCRLLLEKKKKIESTRNTSQCCLTFINRSNKSLSEVIAYFCQRPVG